MLISSKAPNKEVMRQGRLCVVLVVHTHCAGRRSGQCIQLTMCHQSFAWRLSGENLMRLRPPIHAILCVSEQKRKGAIMTLRQVVVGGLSD